MVSKNYSKYTRNRPLDHDVINYIDVLIRSMLIVVPLHLELNWTGLQKAWSWGMVIRHGHGSWSWVMGTLLHHT